MLIHTGSPDCCAPLPGWLTARRRCGGAKRLAVRARARAASTSRSRRCALVTTNRSIGREARDLVDHEIERGCVGLGRASPLNGLPLEANNVLFARDRGEDNRFMLTRYPGRTAYLIREQDGRAEIRRLR